MEAQGHLIDSHLMERIFDTVVEYHGRFEVEEFRIGKTNAEPSYLRMKVETADPGEMHKLLSQLLGLGCSPADTGDAASGTRGTRLLRAGGFLFDYQSPDADPEERELDRSRESADGRDDRGRGGARGVPAACGI